MSKQSNAVDMQDNRPKTDEFKVNEFMLANGFEWDDDSGFWLHIEISPTSQQTAKYFYNLSVLAKRSAINKYKQSLLAQLKQPEQDYVEARMKIIDGELKKERE